MRWLDHVPWLLALLLCVTLGLAPLPQPHVLDKLGMLARGDLTRPIDVFDLFLHGFPWLLLGAKAIREAVRRRRGPAPPG